ncbi:MAG: aspartate/glutamate racemase family protein [Sphaerochaetaceae bacterium]|jgi:allantoin racemase|nr:aspartate/glutamate racemase family protein [Sphaerochaetaceae bacterium]MDX9809674.1 aspartate/glutamate racemase family protein [Sphaerochaetaceae bacterium]NLV84399.1 hypothetical protein [Spirochaetales bacterium]
MYRIKVIFIGHANEAFIEQQRLYRAPLCSSDTVIDFTSIKKGPETIEQTLDEILASQGIMDEVQAAAREKVDAIIVDCALDPLLSALRECVRIPVVGAAQSSYLMASALADNFSIISPLASLMPAYRRMAREYAVAEKLCSIRCLNIPIEDLLDEQAIKAFIEAGRTAIERDGAQVLVLGCTGMSPVVPQLSAALNVPIVDPAATAIAMAESMVRLHLTHSAAAYPFKPLS